MRVKYLGRAPLSGDDSYERKYLASQSWPQFAAKGKTPNLALSSIIEQAALPAENPENLARPWTAAAPRAAAASADPTVAAWKATAKTVQSAPPQITGSIAPNAKAEAPVAGLVIQAGSFKSKDNADRARTVLAAIAAVDVTPVEVGAETYFRVRVGPFTAASEAKAALVKVTGAGYRSAKLVRTN